MKYIHWGLLETGNRENGLAWFMEKAGMYVIPGGAYSRPLQTLRAYIMLVGYVINAGSVYFDTLETFLQGSAYFVVVGFIAVSSNTYVFYRQPTLKKFFALMDEVEARPREDVEDQIYRQETNSAWKYVDIYWNIIIYYNFIYVFIPVILDSLVSLVFPGSPSLRLGLPMEGCIRITGQRTLANLCVTVVSMSYSTCTMISNGCIEASMYYSIAFARTQMKIICMKLQNLKEELSTCEEDADRRTAKAKLKDIVKQHQLTIKMIIEMNDIYGFPVACQNLVLAVCFCVNLYAVTVLKQGNLDFSAIQDSASAILLFGLIYTLCNLGESLETQNNAICENVYDLPWYQEDVSFRNDVAMMLIQTERECYVSYKNGYRLNVDAFMQIMNTSYSYYMMMRTFVG